MRTPTKAFAKSSPKRQKHPLSPLYPASAGGTPSPPSALAHFSGQPISRNAIQISEIDSIFNFRFSFALSGVQKAPRRRKKPISVFR
jgi:hypothetical protein